MRAVVVIDALSHWCLRSMDAVERLSQLGVPVEIVLAPVGDGTPLGVSVAMEAWAYDRGALAYGTRLRDDWYENPESTTWHADAAALAGGDVSGDLASVLRAVMRGAMIDGGLFGRPHDVRAFVAEFTGSTIDEIARRCEDPALAQRLYAGNRRLTELGGNERPTFHLSNDNGDVTLLKGMWQTQAVEACAKALISDERAYAEAGAPPA